MRRILNTPIILLLLILVSFSMLPSITLLKDVKAVKVRPTLPLQTTITSAVDGNNAPVQNGGTTSSNFILFTFTTSGGAPPYRYICTLDILIFKCDTAPPLSLVIWCQDHTNFRYKPLMEQVLHKRPLFLVGQ